MPEILSCLIRKLGQQFSIVSTISIYLLLLNIPSIAQDSLILLTDTIIDATVQIQTPPDDGIPVDSDIIGQGQTLFKNNCAVCHAVHEQVVGPALAGVHERRPLPWLQSWFSHGFRQ